MFWKSCNKVEEEGEQGLERLQAFTFCVAIVNDECMKTKLGLKESFEFKLNDCICVELRLKFGFESDWYYRNILNEDSSESNCP